MGEIGLPYPSGQGEGESHVHLTKPDPLAAG